MAIQAPKSFHQHILAYLTLAIDNIFSSITITTKHLKAKYKTRVQANGFKLLLRELQEAEHTRIPLDWVSEHRQEMRRVNNIIQREMLVGTISRHYEIQVQHESPPEPSTLKKLQEYNLELKLLNIEYFQHLERMAELMERKPLGRLVHRYTKNLRHKPKQLWNIERTYCQLRGGCCSRECGCCERPWHTIRHPSGKVRHMHCTGSCGCCTRHRDYYSPIVGTNQKPDI
ncbi:unnamed protein product [Penicillium nalgiovense]|uniref:Uncharacterized protein n=1 Tax=Penicillium nalgiovense TaxID=60175 RepID=A0A9W4H8B5_PENNA|nr:unnamed protein product [Penicillium nalgiovense]CAG7937507.1 unnamed protein product [Penicillium nalgiovense]CAG7937593.1 unnamed protein product [Penicillium nalgiovense]CAG7938509.1 unnamed protein product [Penicillium nalgiovense]CAG7939485.1 unnamed protein product [Penicillium nalgiovense]